jgi:hypothetical protein
MTVATNIKFLWLELDKCMNWKNHIDKILPRMSSAGYAFRSTYYFSCVTGHIIFYFAYFHSVMEYGIIFWGNSKERKRVFQLQKKIFKIMTGSGYRNYCKPPFHSFEILT